DTSYDAHFGTHMEYVELVVNGEYRGLYGGMEPVDSTQLQISDQEYLYKRTFSRALSTELLDSYTTEEYLTVLGTELKGSDDAGTDYDWQCFRFYVELEEETDDEAFVSGAEALLDLDNMTDIWLFVQMIYGEDNIYKNMFYVFKKESDGYRMYQVPWDLDLTWGNVYTDDAEQLYVMSAPELAEEKLAWPFADRLIALDAGGIREKISEKWEELRKTVLSDESMETLLEGCIHEVQDSGAFARDAARWPDSAHDGDYDALREFMEARLTFLDEELVW
ncbi:MAG: CotH kinase family protein, partial [Lachnospiraceae bacterium]|nr:CotH kinase family protein [Lachnospiraceae bacterium]